ncbi:MAG: hypothetical protein WCX31_09390 [Salinivirgaceae bacterium]
MKKILFYGLVVSFFMACQPEKPSTTEPSLIKKSELKLTSDIQTPEVLWSFGRLGDVQVSPDGTQLLYGVSYLSIEQNKSNRELFIMDVDGANKKQITQTKYNEYNAVWLPNGKQIVFLSPES